MQHFSKCFWNFVQSAQNNLSTTESFVCLLSFISYELNPIVPIVGFIVCFSVVILNVLV